MLALPVENQISLIKPDLQEQKQLFSYYGERERLSYFASPDFGSGHGITE